MVRFSDMLRGSGEPEDPAAAESPYAELADDEEESRRRPAAPAALSEANPTVETADATVAADVVKEPVPMSTFETPEAVLSRLTQYATSARATENAAPAVEASALETPPDTETVADAESEAEDPLTPVGDDFLPNVRGVIRRAGRGRKRHP